MLNNLLNLLYLAIFVFVLNAITKQIFNFILRGFAPFIVSRPWVVEHIMVEIRLLNLKEGSKIYSIGNGRSGLLRAIEKEFPSYELIGVEDTAWTKFLAVLQIWLRGSHIKVINEGNLHHLNISDADVVYCRLDPPRLRELEKKFKFECKPGAKIISNGFIVPNFTPKKVVVLDGRQGRLTFLSKNREIWKPMRKRSKKENKVYFYEV